MKHAFIFDMDGVIVDSNPTHKIALKQFCKKLGYDLSETDLREKIYGRTNRDWLLNLFGQLDEQTIRKYADEKEALFRQLYIDIKPVNGLLPFLDKLDSLDISRAIATSAPRANVDFTLQKTNTGKYFKTILDDSFVTEGKPNPQIYLKSASALGFDPQNCIVFEDSLSGVQAGKRAGCKVVGITTTHTREELAETDFIIDDFENLGPESLISLLY
ncbi:MAG TPA: HAD family phosphatase [Chryseolinea sp.]|nr:HAD family phosphatase [Chryseolinea sp.]